MKHHADTGTQQIQVLPGVQNILAVEFDFSLGTLPWVQAVHAVKGAQQGRLATARRANEGGDFVLCDVEIDIHQPLERAIEKTQVSHFNGCFFFQDGRGGHAMNS